MIIVEHVNRKYWKPICLLYNIGFGVQNKVHWQLLPLNCKITSNQGTLMSHEIETGYEAQILRL